MHEILSRTGQRTERLSGVAVRLEHPEAMMIGPGELAQHERVEPVGLPTAAAKARACRRGLVGVDRDHGQPRVQQPLNQHAVGSLDRDPLNLHPHECAAQRPEPCLVVRERSRQQLLARLTGDVHVVLLRRPNPPQRNCPSRSSPCWSDSSTAPRPGGTVAVAHRQGPPRGYVLLPLAAPHHRREGLVLQRPSTGPAPKALTRRRSRPTRR